MKKLMGLTLLMLLGLVVSSDAATSRGAKASIAVNYTSTISTITANGAGVVYELVLSSGAAGDFVALYDAATGSGLTVGGNTSLKTRVFFSSATANTVVTFDPPLQFYNGIQAAMSTATNSALVVYEKGRVVSGY